MYSVFVMILKSFLTTRKSMYALLGARKEYVHSSKLQRKYWKWLPVRLRTSKNSLNMQKRVVVFVVRFNSLLQLVYFYKWKCFVQNKRFKNLHVCLVVFSFQIASGSPHKLSTIYFFLDFESLLCFLLKILCKFRYFFKCPAKLWRKKIFWSNFAIDLKF